MVVHAAAPCPPEVKRAMIGWLGPIIEEYYAASEANCYFAIGSADWLAHPGSVGRPLLGTPHILDDDGAEVAAGQAGKIWIEGPAAFTYHNDAAQDGRARSTTGAGAPWATSATSTPRATCTCPTAGPT